MVKRVFLILWSLWTVPLLSQDLSLVKEKETLVKTQYGFEKLTTLLWLSDHYRSTDSRKAQRYAKQANLMSDNFLESAASLTGAQVATALSGKLSYGKVQYQRENYVDARKVFKEALKAASENNYWKGGEEANRYLQRIDSLSASGKFKENIFNRTLKELDVSSAFSNSKNSMATATELKMAKHYETRGNFSSAIFHYRKAVNLLKNRGEFEKAREIERKIQTYQDMHRADSVRQEITRQSDSTHNLVLPPPGQEVVSRSVVPSPVQIEQDDQAEMDQLKAIAEDLERKEDYQDALEYYKRLTALQRKWEQDSLQQISARSLAESEMERLRQQNEIADLNIVAIQREKEEEVRLKNILVIIATIIAIATFGILFLYVTKRKKHRQLSEAYDDLGIAKGRLEAAEKHIVKLLEQQVSPEIASALITEKPQRRKQFVTVMFLDIRGFTPMAEKMNAEELIEYQNNVFGFMIEIITRLKGNINQFMGDGFMATFGAPVSHGNDAQNAFLAAKEILQEIKERNLAEKIPHTVLGIGLHAGDVVTGNVGTETRKQFSVTGNTVIIAARIEQLNKTYGSQLIITEEVYSRLGSCDYDKPFETLEVNVKGRKRPVKILIMDQQATAVEE